MSDGYTDEVSPEDEALLRQHEENGPVPLAEDGDNTPTPEQVAAENDLTTKGEPTNKEPAAPAPPPTPGAPQPNEDERLKAFLEQHKGKTPEELLQLAFQQTSRANQAGFQARQASQQLDGLRDRARAAIERVNARRGELKSEREAFAQRLQDDPDAATRDVHERLLTNEERELELEELRARRADAIGLASTAIPNFDPDATFGFGAEMNYTPEELANVTDPRDIVTLHLASLTGRLIKAGVMDAQGQLLQMPQAVDDSHPALRGREPVQTLGSAPARTNGGGSTTGQQLVDITKMTDAQFDEFAAKNPELLEKLLKDAG